ncbi:hypothetical protein HNQ60_005359 [Povalibacter uvarum]|uniref:Uncharacterized protein n=1 Tax=Povalibacter uvarum TaxID=732238 RepID=A0A841HSX9_9GAMM|nr:hypothetical protein [Povalibacter uvarum]MBB6096437.1 hypothetical protein [Povalibacter uvarum]
MKALNGKPHPWLQRTGQMWKFDLEGYLGLLGFFSFGILLLSLVASIFISRAWLLGVALMSIYLLLGFVSAYVFYYRIRCPKCGHNPTRRKDGKWASSRHVETKLQKMELCPVCELQTPAAVTQTEGL